MKVMQAAEQAVQHATEAMPGPVLAGVNWSAFAGAVGSLIAGTIIPAVVGVLSAVWLGCQIWLFFKTRPWRNKRK